MSPALIALIAKAGPVALRALRTVLPGKAGEVAGKLATVAEAVAPLAPVERETAIAAAVSNMTPDERRELVALSVKLREIDAGDRADDRAAEVEAHREAQTTIRAEATGGSEYARNSRPFIARQAYQAGGAYALLCEVLTRLAGFHGVTLPGTDPAILATLLAPVGFYMTMRTIDGFTKLGRTH